MMRKHLNKMMMEDKAAALTKQRGMTHHPRSRLVLVAIKVKTKTGEKKQKNVFDLATAKKNSVPKKSPKKRNMPQERAATS